MRSGLAVTLKKQWLNNWRLFWLLAIPLSLLMLVEMTSVDLATPDGVSHMIGYSVRWSVPFIYLVVAASALQALYPGTLPAWLLRNRKIIGLLFAVAMAWQGAFIYIMSTGFREYYFEAVYFFRDELEGSTGYLFLTAMVLTSFRFGRRHLSSAQWKLLHRSGVYFLWAYPFAVYWWNLYYYESPQLIDYVLYWAGFTAFALRIAAWGKRRRQAMAKAAPAAGTPRPARVAGGAVIALGLLAAATGLRWQDPVTSFLTTPAWSAELELWLPFWPFEPFMPLLIIGFGTFLMTVSGATSTAAGRVAQPAD